MRPWKLASEIATLDNLSDGRVILSVGLGAIETGWSEFGEEVNRKIRAELLDESLDILQGLFKGGPFNYNGNHYKIKEFTHFPPPSPIQKPSVPIWVVGAWNHSKSMNRVIKYNEILPTIINEQKEFQKLTKSHVSEIREYIETNKENEKNIDIIIESHNIEDDRVNNLTSRDKIYNEWEEVGATWWIEGMWDIMKDKNIKEKLKDRIKIGP
jgi:alkanesulfonate monooxygenase SsuD/methylene tetrahydromethanopterin reductase-like flavin-dependent oxidoreductase (luciferase family)